VTTVTFGSGPQAAQYLQALTSFDLNGLTFGKSAYVPIEGFNLHVARGGYTGEDGFEVIVRCIFARSNVVNERLSDIHSTVTNG
jgi:glycine cleavage system aminomethyltransferase T